MDHWDNKFTSLTPPPKNSNSFRSCACRYETSEYSNVPRQSCPYKLVCERASARLLEMLPYGSGIVNSLSEPSSSIVTRSEHLFHKEDSLRLTIRKHFYETEDDQVLRFEISKSLIESIENVFQLDSETAFEKRQQARMRAALLELSHLPKIGANFFEETKKVIEKFTQWPADKVDKIAQLVMRYVQNPTRCNQIGAISRLGSYLGFADIRTNSLDAPVALAVLVPPRVLRNDVNAIMALTEISHFFGVSGYKGSLYSTHEPTRGGARCAQACIVMALGCLADRKAKMLGSFDATFIARSTNQLGSQLNSLPRDCLMKTISHSFKATGLTMREVLSVLNSDHCNTSASLCNSVNTTKEGYEFSRWLFERILQASVEARFPIILFVHAKEWNENYVNAVGHCVVVVGGVFEPLPWDRKADDGMYFGKKVFSELIVHDPSYRPYQRVDLDHCMNATAAYHKMKKEAPGFNAITVQTKETVRSIKECFALLVEDSKDNLFIDADRSIVSKAFLNRDSDLRCHYVHRDDIYSRFLEKSQIDKYLKSRKVPGQIATNLENSWYWCIVVYTEGAISKIWAFNSKRKVSGAVPYELSIACDGQSTNQVLFHPDFESLKNQEDDDDKPVFKDEKEEDGDSIDLWSLQAGFMTSSTNRELIDCLHELRRDDVGVDCYLVRNQDLHSIQGYTEGNSQFDPSLQFLANCNYEDLADWLQENTREWAKNVKAFATYLPDISTLCHSTKNYRGLAINSLANCVLAGIEHSERHLNREVVVECVGGTLADRCNCARCQSHDKFVVVSSQREKIRAMFDAVREVKAEVERRASGKIRASWTLAFEFEPGPCYVLNNLDALRIFYDLYCQEEYGDVRKHVSVNLDVAHFQMCEMLPKNLLPYIELFSHGHLSDHPGLHTHDQPIGSWSAVEQLSSSVYGYLLLLAKAMTLRRSKKLPISGMVSCELEGCNQIGWIESAIQNTQKIVRILNVHHERVARIHF